MIEENAKKNALEIGRDMANKKGSGLGGKEQSERFFGYLTAPENNDRVNLLNGKALSMVRHEAFFL
ncbi:hypothetical protein GCM10009119_34930 [Algoriphagus jejuensis]|uniref:Uncharacterized protein n=1 Tax=Algoriphagus jejuensis TaxID=419934 RepID=A0ABP3YIB6_9BACT